jgi:hypothetical protein
MMSFFSSIGDFFTGAYRCLMAQVNYLRFGKEVTTKVLADRLTICSKCPFENSGVCMGCGCILAEKARMSTEDCPNGFWTQKEPNVENLH